MEILKTLVLDFDRNNYNTTIAAKQGDTKSRYIEVILTKNGLAIDITNHTVKVFVRKPDNTIVFNNVEVLDASNGKVKIELTNQMLAVVGLSKYEISIYGADDSILATQTFCVNVEGTLRDDNAIESSNEFTALTEAVSTVNQYDNRIENVENNKADKTFVDQNFNSVNSALNESANFNAKNQHGLKYREEVNSQSDYTKMTGNKGCVVFQDDGGRPELIQQVKPLLDQYGIKMCIAMEINALGQTGRITMDDLKMWYDEGHEILSHSMTHPAFTSLTKEQIIYELSESKRILKENGMEPSNFVYPYFATNTLSKQYILKYYRSGSGSRGTATAKPPLQQEDLPRITLGAYQTLTTDEIKEKCLSASQNGEAVIFCSHVGLETETTVSGNSIQPVKDLIKYCVDNNIDILTTDQMMDRMGNIFQIGNMTTGDYFLVGADKKVYTDLNLSGVMTIPYTTISIAQPPSFYNQYLRGSKSSIIYCAIALSNNPNTPNNKLGTLITHKVTTTGRFDKQEFIGVVADGSPRFVRYGKDGTDEWTTWEQLPSKVQPPIVKLTYTDLSSAQPPSFYNQYMTDGITKIIYTTLSIANNPNSPDNSIGTLVTHKVTTSGAYDKQEFYKQNTGDMWIRVGLSGSDGWSAWKKVTTV